MKRCIVILLLLTAYNRIEAQEFKVDTLLYNGLIENRINYVILGDGYTEQQLNLFLTDAQNLSTELFNTSPYKEYSKYFNIFTVSVPSNEEGASEDPANLIDNYFGSTFNYAGIERLLVATRESRVSEVLVEYFPFFDQVFMLVNSPKYGGSGGWVATASTHEQSTEVAIHELGHSFAGLADEYWAGEQFAWETYNMTKEISSDNIRWRKWLGDENIDIISHSGNGRWKKPHNNCKMQVLGPPFCAVCREQFVNTIHELVFGIDGYSPQRLEEISDSISFEIDLLSPQPNTLKILWDLNDQEINEGDSSIQLKATDFNSGRNVLRANVFDTTTYNRRTTVYVTSVQWTVSNELISFRSKTEKSRINGVITSIDAVKEESFRISVFPNPATSNLTIEYQKEQASDIQLFILNEMGQVIQKIGTSKKGRQQSYEVDLSNFETGIYFVKIQSETFDRTIKFIKQN